MLVTKRSSAFSEIVFNRNKLNQHQLGQIVSDSRVVQTVQVSRCCVLDIFYVLNPHGKKELDFVKINHIVLTTPSTPALVL